MMGLNNSTDGVIAGEDVLISASYPTPVERAQYNFAESARRVKEMGFVGLGRHLLRKTLVNYADGTFAWGREGEFYLDVHPAETTVGRLLQRLYYNRGEMKGDLHPIFATFEQSLWLLLLMFCLIALVASDCCKQADVQIIVLTLIGLTLFETLFEARARYLYAYAPYYVVLAVLGMRSIWLKLSPVQITENHRSGRLAGVLAVCCLLCGVAVTFCGVYDLSAPASIESIDSPVSVHKTGTGHLQDAPTIQHFTASKPFISVDVMVSTRNKKHKAGTLTLTLADAKGKAVGEQIW